MKLTIPENYTSPLNQRDTEKAIKQVKDFFQEQLEEILNLRRVTAPLFVLRGTGINDDLNGTENAVNFGIKDMNNNTAEVVHSLAKWKRLTLSKLEIPAGYGIYTDMNAIRADEELTNIHSLYVDQWDWEITLNRKDRSLSFLKETVTKLFKVLKQVEQKVYEQYPQITPHLPESITFIHSEDLLAQYPELTPFERECKAAKQYGAIFVIGIGGALANGEPHDGRAPDYDDWTTTTEQGYKGLNGDIVLWNPVLNRAFEISSMGIRVDEDAMDLQLQLTNKQERRELMFHKMLLEGELPCSIGGGIGQSRLCMFFLKKAHIGEVQASIWPEEMMAVCEENGIELM